MYLRSLLTRSPLIRIVLLLLVAVFFVVCGLHLAAAHHDAEADGLGLGLGQLLSFVLLVSIMIVTLWRRVVAQAGITTEGVVRSSRNLGDLSPSGALGQFPLLI